MNDKSFIFNFFQNSNLCIFTCCTQYHALLASTYILKNHLNNKCHIVLFSSQKKTLSCFRDLSCRLSEQSIRSTVIKRNKVTRALGIDDIKNHITLNKILKSYDSTEFSLINFAWNTKVVLYPANIYFKNCTKTIFIEDGASQFVTPTQNSFLVLLKALYGSCPNFWNKKKLQAILVQQPENFPKEMSNKIIQFNAKSMLTNIDSEMLDKLVASFIAPEYKHELQILQSKTDCVIFSQPFSEDGYISEAEKKNIFESLIKHYQKYGNVTLKVHPRDTSIYSTENANVIYGNYPSELLYMMGITFKLAIGVCTSAIYTINAKKAINLNMNYLHELKFSYIDFEELL